MIPFPNLSPEIISFSVGEFEVREVACRIHSGIYLCIHDENQTNESICVCPNS